MTDLLLVRVLFVALIACVAYFLRPFALDSPVAAGIGAAVGVAVVIFEIRIKRVTLKRLIGAAVGSLLGICGAYLMGLVIDRALPVRPPPGDGCERGGERAHRDAPQWPASAAMCGSSS